MTRPFPFLVAVALLAGILIGHPTDLQAAVSTGSIAGTTVDTNGLPVAGATVLLSGQGFTTQTISDSAGTFRFNRIPVGPYGLTAYVVRGNEVGTGSATAVVQNRKTTNVTIVMTFSPI